MAPTTLCRDLPLEVRNVFWQWHTSLTETELFVSDRLSAPPPVSPDALPARGWSWKLQEGYFRNTCLISGIGYGTPAFQMVASLADKFCLHHGFTNILAQIDIKTDHSISLLYTITFYFVNKL